MKILQLITENQLRGAEVFAAQLSDMLVERGHEVVLAAVSGGEQVLATRPEVRQVTLGGRRAGRLPVNLRTWRNLRRLVHEFRPDVVQANGSETLKYGVLLRLIRPSLPVVYRNISVMSMWSGSTLKRALVGFALRRMSHIASVTKVGKTDLVDVFGVPEERVAVVPIGVHIPAESSAGERQEARAVMRQRFGLPPDAPVVAHVGSFTPEKNHAELLEAFAQVAKEIPSARLLLVGDGPLRPEIQAAVRRLDLVEAVVLGGVVPSAGEVIAAADALALPSLREGLPGVILEAGAAGVPVVAYDVGGVSEVVEDGVTGVVVRVGDVEGLAARLVELLNDPGSRARMGAQARVRVAEAYALDCVTGRFEEVYQSVVRR